MLTHSSSADVIAFRPKASFTQASQNWFRQWRRNDQLNHSDRTFIAELYDHFNTEIYQDTGELWAWPAWLTIAEAGLSKMSIGRSAKKVERLGAVEIVRSRDPKTGWRLQNKYRALPGNNLIPGQVTNPGIRMRHEESKEETNLERGRGSKESGLSMEARKEKRMAEKIPEFFIPPAPVKPGFDRASPAEHWGHIGRPSKLKTSLPEGWRPARELTPREEERLQEMHLWVKANAIEKADWAAYFELWVKKSSRGDGNGRSGSILAAADRLGERLKAAGATDSYVPGSSGPRPLRVDQGPRQDSLRKLPPR